MACQPRVASGTVRSIAVSAQRRARLSALVIGLVATGLVALLLARVPPLAVLVTRILMPLALGATVILASVGTGALFRALMARALYRSSGSAVDDRSPPRPQLATEFVGGLPVLGALSFIVGLASTSAAAQWCVAGPLLAVGVARLASSVRAGTLRPSEGPDAAPHPLAIGVLLVVVGVGVLLAQLPPYTLDELAYHLAVPKSWVLEGHVVPLPLNSQASFPSGVESAALPLLALAGDRGAIAFHFVILANAASTLFILFAWLRRRTDARSASLVAACVATTPALAMIAGVAWVDWPLAGAGLALAAALDEAADGERATPSALASVALATAAGALTKYTFAGLMFATFGGALVAARRDRTRIARLGLAGGAGLTAGSVFFVRNLIASGNPVAPFFDPTTPHVARFNDGATPLELLLNYVFDPMMADESLGIAWLVLPVGVALGHASLRSAPHLRATALLALVPLAAAFGLGAAGRLLFPFTSLIAGIGGVGLAHRVAPHAGARRATEGVLLAIAMLQALFVVTLAAQPEPLSVLSVDERAYVAAQQPSTAAIAWVDARLPTDSLTLVIGVHESYWFDHRVRSAGNFDGPRMEAYLRTPTSRALFERLRHDGFTHVAVFQSRLQVGASSTSGRRAERRTTLTPGTAAILREMLATHARTLDATEDVTLLALAR
jgi:hypothetical protein